MKPVRKLGEFELLVMAAVMRLGDKAYGTNIRREIEDRTDRSISVGAIYTTLSRMEEKGFVFSTIGEATSRRGGRAKRYFSMTGEGKQAFDASLTSLSNMLEGVISWPTTN